MQDLHLELEKLRDELKLFSLAKENAVADDPLQGTILTTQKLV